MKIIAQWFFVFILAAILLAYVTGEAADKQSSRLYARAHLSEVQNEGRKDLMAGLMPYVVISVSLIVSAIVVIALASLAAVGIYAMGQRPAASQPMRVIETRTILILQPGEHSRREIFKLLSD